MKVPELEKKLGIEVYASQSIGLGGRIRQFSEDFVVEEILVDGSKAGVSPIKVQQPVGRGRHLICVMIKRDWDTFQATEMVAKRLGIGRERISIAGIKDAKAFTAQHISISRMMPEQVAAVGIKDITLRPLRFSDERVFPQHIMGNNFHILIRAMSHKASVIEQRVEETQNELSTLGGAPNFFGHQRFGTVRPITHTVGRFLIQRNWKRAALTLLAEPSEYEHPESRTARQQLGDTQDFSTALRYFPEELKYERLMLRHLAKRPNDFVGAFQRLPLKLCKLFVQAYQSYIFNKFLSERVRRLSLTEVYVGDYVIDIGTHGVPTKAFKQVTAKSLLRVKKALGKSKMCIGIPLIGIKQETSGGVEGEIEREITEAENVEPQDFCVSEMPAVSAAGTVRPLLAPISNLSTDAISKDSVNPSQQKMRLHFTLPRGSYATVVLREFMKPRDLIKAGF